MIQTAKASAAITKYPNVDAFSKEPKCVRDAQERGARKDHEPEVSYLAEAQVAWAASIAQMQLVPRPLVQAWE
ncbi:MAG TPA: hypothetical protein VFO94_18440 [Gammaproteobacteria bacterium]|nr:hypothetical protein [Gammaproteobacteria bacterium]